MSGEKKTAAEDRFPSLKPEMLNRLNDEAELRTLRPQIVDWEEIHRQAAAARAAAS